MSDLIIVEQRGAVTICTINRPGSMNAMDRDANFEMSAAIDKFDADPDQRVLIVTGAGDRAFSAGNDLKQTAPAGKRTPETGFGGLTHRFDLNKPVIAAVNGLALGGGFELALACDLIVAAENATFGLPEARVGLAAMGGGLLRLPGLVGTKRAMDLILTARRMDAAEALEWGIINRIAPQGQALEMAIELAGELLLAAPLSIRASKATVRRVTQSGIDEAMWRQLEFPEIREMLDSEDAKEGPRAFAEKRPPVWRGT